jgi:hypothetical protein
MATPTESRRAHALNDLLQGEIAATETYVQALEKFKGQPEQATLTRLRDDHVDASNQLKRHVPRLEKPATSSGAWGAFAKAVEGTAKVFGKSAALKALQEGEEHGTKLYARGLADKDLDPSVRMLLGNVLLPRQEQHVHTLKRLAQSD